MWRNDSNKVLEFINNKIISFHQGTKKNLRLIGKLKQNTSESSKVQYSKDLLNRIGFYIFSTNKFQIFTTFSLL